MAGTRRSTRQAPSAAPKYAEEDSSPSADEAPKKGRKSTTRRKRAHKDVDDDDDAADNAPSPKKKKRKATKPKPPSQPSPNPPTDSKPPTKPPPTPSNPTNRDAAGGAQEVFWLLKAEPLPRYENGVNVAFSISDLAACTAPEPWSGVRNPQACNNMRAMRAGDLGFFYHSNAKPSGVVGILRVVNEAHVDDSAFDSKDPYFDKKSVREKPRWWCVDVEFVRKFEGEGVVALGEIKAEAGKGGRLEGMQLVSNSRLSVSRVRRGEWDVILEMAEEMEKKGKGEEGEEEEKGGEE